MSFIIGASIVGAVVIGYVGRKGWLAFHRAVGITPGTLKYIEPAQLPPPQMIQLQVDDTQLIGLPMVVLEQLQRIDNKADIYQQWKDELTQAGQTPVTTEEEFVLTKLLSVRLPEVLNSYQRFSHHQTRLQQTYIGEPDIENSDDVLALLLQLLLKIEAKLDNLLKNCQNCSIQDMKVMSKYLSER